MMDEIRLIEVKEDIQADNEKIAEELRRRLSDQKIFLVNLMSSPGAGKTSVILKTIEQLRGELAIGVLEADIDSTVDAEKVAAVGVRAVQLRTGSERLKLRNRKAVRYASVSFRRSKPSLTLLQHPGSRPIFASRDGRAARPGPQ